MKILISLPALFVSASALAAPIVFDAAGTFAYDYTAIGGDQLRVSTLNNGLFSIGGAAFTGPDTGTFVLGPLGPVSIGPSVAGVFAFPATESFSFVASDGDALSGTVTWSEIDDDTLDPAALGTLAVTSSSGDPDFLASWGGAPFEAPISFSMTVTCSLDHLAAQDGSCPADTGRQESMLYAGGVADHPTDVPEGSTLAFVMTALAGFWWFRRPTSEKAI